MFQAVVLFVIYVSICVLLVYTQTTFMGKCITLYMFIANSVTGTLYVYGQLCCLYYLVTNIGHVCLHFLLLTPLLHIPYQLFISTAPFRPSMCSWACLWPEMSSTGYCVTMTTPHQRSWTSNGTWTSWWTGRSKSQNRCDVVAINKTNQ